MVLSKKELFYIGISKLKMIIYLVFVGLCLNEEDYIQKARSSRTDSEL